MNRLSLRKVYSVRLKIYLVRRTSLKRAINDLKELHKKYNIDPTKLDDSIKQGLKDLHDPNKREIEI
jgi:aminoglycoside phosphotransferase